MANNVPDAEAQLPHLLQDEIGSIAKQALNSTGSERVHIQKALDGSRVFMRNGKEHLLIGGNYVLKARPYFPPIDVIRADAKRLSEDVKNTSYKPQLAKDGTDKEMICLVRLGCMMEGSMPTPDGKFDPQFLEDLEGAVAAFAEYDVQVVLEMHMDAFCASNAGEGVPWWIADQMQKSQGCTKASAQCWGGCCCCFGASSASYITTPEHPLELALPSWLTSMTGLGSIKTMANDPNPWESFSIGSDTGNPGYMNIGNLNMRLNNSDSAWNKGTLIFSKQVQNIGTRLYASPYDKEDSKTIFQPFVQHVEMLCRVWERHSNVVAVELLNEPPLTGLPNVFEILRSRRRLWDFHLATLEALERCEPPIQAPIALEDGFGSIGGSSSLTSLLMAIPISSAAKKKMQEWGSQNRLILSFHYYPGGSTSATDMEFQPFLAKARKLSQDLLSNSPIWLSEFWRGTAEEDGQKIVEALELGSNAVTFWHFANTEWTGTRGWYKYPANVLEYGEPIAPNGEVNEEAWKAYVATVEDGTFFGALINGAAGAKQAGFVYDPLAHMPEQVSMGTTLAMNTSRRSTPRARLACCCF